MKLFVLVIFFIICTSCDKSKEQNLLYNQLVNYRNDLKMNVESQNNYLFIISCDNIFFKKRYDSLNNIRLELEKSFEKLRYLNNKKVLSIRDDFNNKYQLNIKFESYEHYKNVNDSIFNRSIEVDFLRLIQAFQNNKMSTRGDKF